MTAQDDAVTELPPAAAPYPAPWDTLLERLVVREGPYVDDPADHGGPTCWGCTLATLRDWRRDPSLTAWDVSLLSRDEAKQCYWEKWVAHPACRYDLIALDEAGTFVEEGEAARDLILDSAILFGRSRANKWLQEACNRIVGSWDASPELLVVDGVLGLKSRDKLFSLHPSDVVRELVIARVLHHGRRCVAEPSQLRFLNGWLNRSLAFLRTGSG